MTITPITIRWRGRKRLWRLVLCCLVAWPAIAFAHDAEEDNMGEIARSSAVAQLNALLERSDECSLMLNPLNALSRGDVRYSPHLVIDAHHLIDRHYWTRFSVAQSTG